MKWQPYPGYKPSGVEWLGEVPEHWEIWKVTHGFGRIGSGTTPPSDNLSFYEGDIPWVTTSELRESIIYDTNSKVTTLALETFSSLKQYPAGTVLIAMYGATIGRLGILGVPATVNQACCAFSDPIIFDVQFFFYWLLYRKPVLISRSVGGGQPNLSQEDLKALRLATPPLDEQLAIAAFLERETGRIDALMQKKQRQIELLQEKRAALISHAVTKGLDPTVSLKDSGLEWLGEVPGHWECSALKRMCKLTGRIGFRGYSTEDIVAEDEGAITLGPSNMRDGQIDIEKCTYISWDKYYESPEIMVFADDILMVKTGSTYGKVAYVNHIDYPATVNPQIMILKKIQSVPKYLFYVSVSIHFQSLLLVLNTGSTIPTMTQEAVGRLGIPMPPKTEQCQIADFLDRETARLDALMGKIKASIEKLKEYRTALISAAVTGKIDVREEAA